MTKIQDLRDRISATIKGTLAKAERDIREIRSAELRRSRPASAPPCLLCGDASCTCAALLAKAEDTPKKCSICVKGRLVKAEGGLRCDDCGVKQRIAAPKPKTVKVPDSGSGGDPIQKSANPPMAKPPGKAPSAPAPTSMSKSESATIFQRLAKSDDLAKAGPRLGGKDPASQAMTQAASTAGSTPAPAAGSASPKLSPADHARRQAEFSAFTPAGAFSSQPTASATGGAMKPQGGQPGPLDRFKAAGKPKPVGTSALGKSVCEKCMKSSHEGAC